MDVSALEKPMLSSSRWRGVATPLFTRHGGRCTLHRGAVGGAGEDVGVVVGVEHRPRSRSLSATGAGKTPVGLIRPGGFVSSTEADLGGRSHGGPGHGVALPAAGRGWALSRAQ